MRALNVIARSPRSAWTLIGVLQFSLTLTYAYNAAGVWGVEPNATYHPLLSNLMFQTDLRAVDTAFRASGVQGLYQLSWTEPRPEMERLGYCPSPIPRFHNTTACVTLRKDFDEYWQETLEKLQPWRRNGTVVGIFLGDEQCYHGASMRNLTYVTKRIRNDWPEALIYLNEAQDLLMCNFNRMNESFFDSDTEHNCWPAELDWLGFDVYGYDLNTTFDAARATYENNIFARMATTGQSVVATTVGHGGHTAETMDWTLEQFDNYCVQNAERWFSYAEAEPRVAGPSTLRSLCLDVALVWISPIAPGRSEGSRLEPAPLRRFLLSSLYSMEPLPSMSSDLKTASISSRGASKPSATRITSGLNRRRIGSTRSTITHTYAASPSLTATGMLTL